MNDKEQIKAAKKFSANWNRRGDERSDTQNFWTTLLNEVFGLNKPFEIIKFEHRLAGHFIDAIIPSTKILIEQKSYGIDLTKKYLQSDGALLTPFEQARRYYCEFNYTERPRWIITCNFQEFWIYDMHNAEDIDNFYPEPQIIKLEKLNYDYKRLNFLVDPDDDNVKPEVQISKAAAILIEKIRNAFIDNYEENKQTDYNDSLIKICIRLVFCFYAGDSHIFSDNQFFNYINRFPIKNRNEAIQNLFSVLNLRDRSNITDDNLKNFPYVNGGLFEDKVTLPAFNKNMPRCSTKPKILTGTLFTLQFSAQCLSPFSARKTVAQAVCITPALKIFIKSLTRFFSMNFTNDLNRRNALISKTALIFSANCKMILPR